MALKRSPLGRDPLEWIKITKGDETEGTATDRLTQSADQPAAPAEEKQETAPSPAEAPPQTQTDRPAEEAQKGVAPPPAEEPPLTITSTTATLNPEEAEQHLKEATQPIEIPLFAKIEEEEKKQAQAPPEKPAVRPLGLEEVQRTEVEGDAAALEKAATTPPAGVQLGEKAGHSINFMAPGIGRPETVAAPAPESPATEKAEEPVVSAPAVLETPKAEQVLTASPESPAAAAEAEAPQDRERVHVGAVDLRVERRPIPVPPVTKSEVEQPISFASVVMYICILLLAVLVLSAFFGNKSQVSKVRQEIQNIKQQLQQMPNAAGVSAPR